MNYYEVLGVPTDADEEAIRSAFRRLARRYHPDAGEGSSSDRFREITEAYETLMDPARRKDYDRSLAGVPIPVRVFARGQRSRRRWEAAPEPLRTEDAFAFNIAFEVDSLFEQLLGAFENDWLFDWSFDR
jgi:curved DNA-binding protein CbpA